ncbi:MAG: InlB B-repeat-containing protein, partial [Bacilli bacterium]|nr:InlB B-repeat-containing protein [Bacilli bacterium]
MKKFYGFLFAAILLLALVGCSTGNTGGGTTTQFTVSFNTQGGSLIAAQKVNSGATVVKPANPTRNGYSFEGWFTESACTTAVDWTKTITADVTYYAKWKESTSKPPVVGELSCAEDRTQEKCLDPNTFDWNYNRFEFDGKGMEIKLYVGIAAENDPFSSGFTGERASERQVVQTNVEDEYNVKIAWTEYPAEAAWGPSRVA